MPCPAGFTEIAAQLHWLEPGRIAIVPGLCCEENGVPDVMRGEETQVLGALRMLAVAVASGTFVLPGTHSKWVTVRDSRIERFSTCMTGELYALLRQHSILARTLPSADEGFDEEGFRLGVRQARAAGSLLGSAFSARTLALFDRLAAPAMTSYLSGLVIGEELRAQHTHVERDVVVIAVPELARRYALALPLFGMSAAKCIGSEAAWRGAAALANAWRG